MTAQPSPLPGCRCPRCTARSEVAWLDHMWRIPARVAAPVPDRRAICVVCGERIDLADTRHIGWLATTVHRPGSGAGCFGRLRGVKSYPKVLSHFKPIREHFGHWRAVAVTEQAVDACIHQRRRDGKADPTINRETQILGQALRMKVDGIRLPAPPAIRHLTEDNARRDFFEHDEFEAVVSALPAYLHDVVRFAHACGWRKGEIATLRWSDVEGDRSAIRLRAEHSKNGKGRVLGLDDELAALIERRWQARVIERADGTTAVAEYVFHRNGQPIGDFRKAWATACIAAGLFTLVADRPGTERKVPTKLFHGLRRTAIRNMVRARVPERIAMAVSGHKTRAVFDRYNIVNQEDTREAMRVTRQHVNGQVSPVATHQGRARRKAAGQ